MAGRHRGRHARHGPVRLHHPRGIRRPGPVGQHLCQGGGAHRAGLDVGVGHHQLAPHHGRLRAAQRHRGAAPAFSAALCQRRAARRPGPDRARLRHRPAGGAHGGPARRRPLHHQRHQDLDLQRHPWPGLCRAGQDRPRGPAAPPRHEPVHLREGPRFYLHQKAGKARLQGHRQRRAGVRQLPRAGRQSGRRRRRSGLQACAGRARTRAHQCGGARRRRGARLSGRVGGLCPAAAHLWQADLRTPGDPAQAGRHGDPGRGRTPAGGAGRQGL